MSKTKIKILKEILGDYTKTGNEYLFYCLFCKHHKRKLSINLDKNKMKCWVCDVAGDISRLVKRHGTFLQQQDWKELTGQVEISDFEKVLFGKETLTKEPEQVVPLPDEFVSLCNQNTSLTAVQARNYLTKRGIDKADILKWKLGYCSSGQYAGRIIAPSFNVDGQVNYFIARTYDGNWKKYMNPPDSKDIVFNELYVDWDDDIVLVEGVFDAVKVPNSIPILGSTLREDSKLFKQIIKNDPAIYLALDPDAEKKAHVLIDSLMKYGIEVYTVPIKPFKDAGEMSKDEFLRRKKSATLVSSTDNLLMQRILAI